MGKILGQREGLGRIMKKSLGDGIVRLFFLVLMYGLRMKNLSL